MIGRSVARMVSASNGKLAAQVEPWEFVGDVDCTWGGVVHRAGLYRYVSMVAVRASCSARGEE